MSIFKDIFGLVAGIVKGIKGGTSIVDLMIQTVLKIPDMIGQITGLAKADAKEKIDEGLLGFDEMTGTDGVIDLIKTLPQDKEEEALDHFKEFLRVILYNKSKIEGYYIE